MTTTSTPPRYSIAHQPSQKSALARLSSMIALVAVPHFAAEHPVRQRRVGKNDWQDDHRTDEHENLARARCRGSPDAQGGRNDVRKDADQQATVAEKDDGFHQDERARLVAGIRRAEDADDTGQHEQRYRSKVKEIVSAEPTLRDGRLTEHGPQADYSDDCEQYQRRRLQQHPRAPL